MPSIARNYTNLYKSGSLGYYTKINKASDIRSISIYTIRLLLLSTSYKRIASVFCLGIYINSVRASFIRSYSVVLRYLRGLRGYVLPSLSTSLPSVLPLSVDSVSSSLSEISTSYSYYDAYSY
jgi:hypothetical protein